MNEEQLKILDAMEIKLDNIEDILMRQTFRYGDKVFMTGAEWFERFWQEFVTQGDWTSIFFTKSEVIKLAEKAAKKASGLDD